MSVLIQPTPGMRVGAGDRNSTTTTDPNGPNNFWAGLRFGCPVWKTKDLGTTTGGTVYTVGEAYATGYIVPYLCGVAQGPTRFTETDVDIGTFTFDVAPDSGWPIHVDYAVYCDDDFQLHIPTLQGFGLPKVTNSGKVGSGTGPGARVLVAGISAGAPRFAWTDNIYVATPSFTANTTGLPGTATTIPFLKLDPFNPSTIAFLVVDNILYKNTAYRTGGSWSSVLTFGGTVEDVQLSIAAPGFIAVLGRVGGNEVLQHSHDAGATWTSASIAIDNSSQNMVVGQWDNSLVLFVVWDAGVDMVRSTNHGASLASSNTGLVNQDYVLAMPYVGNSNQQEVFAVGFSTQANTVYRSADGGVTWAAYSTPTVVASIPRSSTVDGTPQISSVDSNLCVVLGGALVYKSTDKLVTFSSAAPSGAGLQLTHSAWLRADKFFLAGQVSSAPVVWTADDPLGPYTVRTGNLVTGIFTGATPVIWRIVPDWTS